jgi:hypothetical protein
MDIRLNRTTFINNTAIISGALALGGAAYLFQGSISTFSSTVMVGNTAQATSDARGGALYLTSMTSTCFFSSTVFTRNTALSSGRWARGGAIYLTDASPRRYDFVNTTLSSNRAIIQSTSVSTSASGFWYHYAYGGAIHAYVPFRINFYLSSLVDNVATCSGASARVNCIVYGGAAFIQGRNSPRVIFNSTAVMGNNATITSALNTTATARGGALFLWGVDLRNFNTSRGVTTFTRNIASAGKGTVFGGAIYLIQSCTMLMLAATFTPCSGASPTVTCNTIHNLGYLAIAPSTVPTAGPTRTPSFTPSTRP